MYVSNENEHAALAIIIKFRIKYTQKQLQAYSSPMYNHI